MAYKQRWKEYFEVLDGNKSGVVDPGDALYAKQVFAKYLNKPGNDSAVVAAVGAYSKFFISLIRAFDANKDAKVTIDELLAGVDKLIVGKLDSLPDWWNGFTKLIFDIMDVNKNAELSEEETIVFIKRVDPASNPEDIRAAYNWAKGLSGSGKFDNATFSKVVYEWATSPKPTPEASILTPCFRKL